MRAAAVLCISLVALFAAAVAASKAEILPTGSLGAHWLGSKLRPKGNSSLPAAERHSGPSWHYGSRKPLEITIKEIIEENDWKVRPATQKQNHVTCSSLLYCSMHGRSSVAAGHPGLS
jgi:hypothetical protein